MREEVMAKRPDRKWNGRNDDKHPGRFQEFFHGDIRVSFLSYELLNTPIGRSRRSAGPTLGKFQCTMKTPEGIRIISWRLFIRACAYGTVDLFCIFFLGGRCLL